MNESLWDRLRALESDVVEVIENPPITTFRLTGIAARIRNRQSKVEVQGTSRRPYRDILGTGDRISEEAEPPAFEPYRWLGCACSGCGEVYKVEVGGRPKNPPNWCPFCGKPK